MSPLSPDPMDALRPRTARRPFRRFDRRFHDHRVRRFNDREAGAASPNEVLAVPTGSDVKDLSLSGSHHPFLCSLIGPLDASRTARRHRRLALQLAGASCTEREAEMSGVAEVAREQPGPRRATGSSAAPCEPRAQAGAGGKARPSRQAQRLPHV